ncbi:MAG: hypothetical protein MUC32_08050 [Burkholderiaceae bacterium]|jgi:hypothetical protein|nr:hypothetical protein [Burkholderiaceae bacterium]
MAAGSRDRVTVDLRGAGSVVQARAMAQGLTVAAWVRRAVMTFAEVPVAREEPHPAAFGDAKQRLVKVTLRLPAAHALLLATRARSAEVSQGGYVAGLLDGEPPPRAAPDRREAVAALATSTDQLAVMSADLQTFLRLIRTAPPERVEPYRETMQTLAKDVRAHLGLACRYLADLQRAVPPRHRRSALRGGK